MILRDWYLGLPARDRRAVTIGAPIGAVLLVAGLVVALAFSVSASRERVARKSADLAWLQSVAPRVQSLPAGVNANEALAVVVDRTAREAGLGQALTGATPRDNGALEVRFEGAQFDAVVAWMTRLQQELGVTIGGAVIDRTEAIGVVNVTLTLSRG
ncbi:MAG: type II secretion system protein M [Gammaproteobacteria bacterium]|jgi:type II secretory pathway component PulM|nr:type II secretion system protein M [Gammaproteobacteria bacterium]